MGFLMLISEMEDSAISMQTPVFYANRSADDVST